MAMTRHFFAGFGSCRLSVLVFATSWLVACSALDGGQSGTDSLEAIGVHKPPKGCEENDKSYDVGEETWRGCEVCECQDNGQWQCVADVSCSWWTSPSAAENGSASPDGAETNTAAAPTSEWHLTATWTDPNTSADAESECLREITGPSIGGSTGVYVATDARSSACVRQTSPTELCMAGSIVDPGEDYEFWGGGIGLVMASSTEDDVVVPFDAPSLDIASVRFTLTGINGFMIRAYVNQADDPTITNQMVNFAANGFVLLQTTESGTFTLPIESARLPDWTRLDVDNDGEPDPETPLDPSRLISLQLFVASQPTDGTGFEFDVCVSDVEWLDGDGNTVLPGE